MRFKIDWASLIVGSKFTVFALFYFVFEANFPSTSPHGAYIWRDDLMEVFLRYWFGGAYIWRGLFPEFYGISCLIGFFHFQYNNINPFTPGDFAEKRVLKLVEGLVSMQSLLLLFCFMYNKNYNYIAK